MLASRQAKDINADDVVLGLDAAAIRRSFVEKLFFELAKFPGVATRNDHYLALARAVRDRILHRWIRSARTYLEEQHRTVIYLSAEYLMGPQLDNALFNLGIEGPARQAMESLGLNLDELIEHEEEPGLGNGGLGRLAACFMDSLATLDIPGHRPRHPLRVRHLRPGDPRRLAASSAPTAGSRFGNPWEVRRFEIEHPVGFGGRTETIVDAAGRAHVTWTPARVVRGVPYDTPVVGYGTVTTNFLRLWAAVAGEEFDLDAFQVGEYWRAVDEKIRSENITKVLYPNDASTAGKQLRLEQEYFFVSCALQDCIRLLLQRTTIDKFADKFAIQLNDTHPALAVPELMRLLMDEHGLGWDEAWDITSRSFNYTNHTLLPEALETWPLPLFGRLLPRHLEIVYEINRRFLDEVRRSIPGRRRTRLAPEPHRRARREERPHGAPRDRRQPEGERRRGAALAAPARDGAQRTSPSCGPSASRTSRTASRRGGSSGSRTRACRRSSPRRSATAGSRISTGWRGLEKLAADAGFRERWRAVKQANKERLAGLDPATRWDAASIRTPLFDAQCKRIHEYKRQHLNLLHVAWLYQRILRGEVGGHRAAHLPLRREVGPRATGWRS